MKQEKISIGVDIGGTNIEVGWIKKDGSTLHHLNFETKTYKTVEALVEIVGEAILQDNKKFDQYQILGIGIGAPNGNYYKGTIEFAPNLNWEGIIPLAQMLQEKTGLRTKLTNDANAAAYAEMIYGSAKSMSDFLVVTLGTGLGSGIVVNQQMLYGFTGFAGELGHTKALDNGRPCGCGRNGCLETYVSATGITKTINEMLTLSKKDSILRNIPKLDSKAIFEAALLKDELALKAIDYTGTILGKHLADYVAIFSPEAIFLTGGLAKAHSLLIPSVEKAMNENLLKIFRGTVKIYPSALIDNNAGLLGAAALMT